MKRIRQFWKFVKEITATKYSSDSDDQDELNFLNLERQTQRNTESILEAETLYFNPVFEFDDTHPTDIISRTRTSTQRNRYDRHRWTSIQSTHECIVCLNQKSSDDFSENLSWECNHRHRQICIECVREHVQTIIIDDPNNNIRCPEKNCTAQFDYDIINYLLIEFDPQDTQYKQVMDQFENHLSMKYIETLPGLIWCAHGCGAGSQIVSGDILNCKHCGRQTCVQHKIRWHTGMTCNEYDMSLAVNKKDAATEKWIQTKTKPCPQCRAKIEKNGGCDHMTCSFCRHEFCWECLADYNRILQNGNYEHDHRCTHYT